MKFESLPKHFFHSLKFKMLVGFALMLACIGMMNWISVDRLQAFEDTALHNSQVQLPSLEAAALIQTQVAKLSGLITEITAVNSQAKVRILASEIKSLLTGINHQLIRLEESKAVSQLVEILKRLDVSLEATAFTQNQQIIQNKQLVRSLNTIIQGGLKRMETGSLEQRRLWMPIIQEMTLLTNQTRLFEVVASERKIKKMLLENKASSTLSDPDNELLLKQIMGGVGLFYQLKEKDARRNQLASMTTQNQILLDSITENILRLFDQKSQEVKADAGVLIDSMNQARFNYFVIIAFGLILIVLLLLYLKEILFSRLILLSDLIRSGSLTRESLKDFDLKNEIGDIAFQLSNYLTTIDEQRDQLTQASEQLTNVIKFSKLRIAIVDDEKIVYHNQSFPRLFDRASMTNIQELPAEIANAIMKGKPVNNIGSVILRNYHSEVWQRWFDISLVKILWEGKDSNLISLVDVTDRENAAKEFKETISLVEKESQKDPLTGLYNRKVYSQTLDQLSSQPKGESFAMIVCDIDNFKSFNDCYGHQKGDEALKAVAQVVASVCQQSDVAIRYGGEEFLLVLFNRSEDEIRELGLGLVAQVQGLNIPHKGSDFKCVTMSIGVALKEEVSVFQPRACFELADQRLYIAKRNGRNQLIDQSKSMELEG